MNRHKKTAMLVCIILTALNIVACGQVREDEIINTDEPAASQQESNEQTVENENLEIKEETIQDNVSYDEYSGYWSYEGKTHEQILSGGGIELSCTVTGDNQFSGTLFSQQEITQRFASIEDISGKIEQAELYFDYSDDEWGNSGTLHIQFLSDSIYVEVLNYKKADNGSDYGISGSFELIRPKEDFTENDIADHSSYNSSWTEEEMINAINERSGYYRASAYYSEIIDYWENVREVRDISNVIEPLFETDKKYYTKEEFENEPMLVIHLAKNEIYARHGYIFANEDLYNYFMGCIWYNPTCKSADFNDNVFNEYEKANLEILSNLDVW
ncbi:MAG: YARHG domain-containing protein [Clostridium sp.]|nr:YARHG domain-containing protein [Clostridium sp.]